MKYCPNCQTEYADDTLQFCLQDGTPLVASANQSSDFEREAETLVSPKQVEPIRFEPPSSYQTNQTGWQSSQPVIVEQQREPKKSNTAMIVALTILGTILLLGIGGTGAWLYMRNSQREIAVNINAAPQNRPTNSNAANANQNTNANLATPTPGASPTPEATLPPKEAKAVAEDIKNVIDDWKDASENFDMDEHLSHYAPTVDYYKGGRVSVDKVRADKQRAYDQYDSIDINIDNLKVTPDGSGKKATAIFDKKWKFKGDEKYSSGKVQQQLQLERVNGQWLITGEKDLKVYYVEK
ncbi:MAG: L,D-transpeptidase Cds6 family protein [Pyrinomonadaceae bacterium]